jgi:hypothetical protein
VAHVLAMTQKEINETESSVAQVLAKTQKEINETESSVVNPQAV